MDLGLKNKTALVTGSTDGTGVAIARLLVEEGANVVVHGRDREKAVKVAEDLSSAGKVAIVIADLTEDAQMDRFRDEAVAAFGGVDILVNNAGLIGYYEDWNDVGAADWAKMYDGVTLAVVRPIYALREHMVGRGWGRIINIASAQAVQPFAIMPDYSTAKAAVVALTKSLSKKLDRSGVLANAVCPGIIVTDTIRKRLTGAAEKDGRSTEWGDVEEWVLRNELDNPTGRLARPEDIANLVAFLASDRAGYINGARIMIDGGSVETIF